MTLGDGFPMSSSWIFVDDGSLLEEMDKVLLRGVVTLKVHEECGNGEVRPTPLKVVK